LSARVAPAEPRFPGDFLLVVGPGSELCRSLPGETVRVGPAAHLVVDGDVTWTVEGGRGVVGTYLLVPPVRPRPSSNPLHEEIVSTWRRGTASVPGGCAGRFCFAAWDTEASILAAATDAFRTVPLFYASGPRWKACATDLRWLAAAGLVERAVDLHAVYHYLNFSYIPSPSTILQGVSKLPAAAMLSLTGNGASVTSYWGPTYPEDLRGDDDGLARQLRDEMFATVRRYRPTGPAPWGTFLSGGTDSTSIAAILSLASTTERVRTFSIGFEEHGYDELGFVDVANRRFGFDSHRHRVGIDEALAVVPLLVEAFDEPFGNSSAIPTYLCSVLARDHGVSLLLAGDGGDEIFGGNERYRKDRILGWFHRSPSAVRRMASAVASGLGSLDVKTLNRVRNFVYRSSIPNPDRFYSDDSFASDHFQELLSPDFRAVVGVDESLSLLRETFDRAPSSSEVHRLMYLDLQRTIAESDLHKVGRTAKQAGVAVAYPYLDPALVEFTGRLPAWCKLRRLEKRYLFKRALRDVLPPEILNKRKQGFALPTAVWIRERTPFRALVEDVVLSRRARERGYFNVAFIEGLLARHTRGVWDHSSELFQLLMLELWHRAYLDG
jgi:asparagine synthase (glutamine-hydrolysing)